MKRHGHICDECNQIFTCFSLDKYICKVCQNQLCDKCSFTHYTPSGNNICLSGLYDYNIDSIKKLVNWKYTNIQIYCPLCNNLHLHIFSEIDPYDFICNECRNRIQQENCKHSPIFEECVQFGGETLYRKLNHFYQCSICEIHICKDDFHYCQYLNIPRFNPRIAYVYSKKHVTRKIMTILCCFKRKLREIHRDVIWKYIINYLDWTVKINLNGRVY